MESFGNEQASRSRSSNKRTHSDYHHESRNYSTNNESPLVYSRKDLHKMQRTTVRKIDDAGEKMRAHSPQDQNIRKVEIKEESDRLQPITSKSSISGSGLHPTTRPALSEKLREQIKSSKQTKNDVKMLRRKVEFLEKEKLEKQNQIDTLKNEIKELKDEKVELREEKSELRSISKVYREDNERLKSENLDLKVKNQQLADDKLKLTERLASVLDDKILTS